MLCLLSGQAVLHRWLAAQEQEDPLVNRERVCGEHFVNGGYVEETAYWWFLWTNRLRSEASPSLGVFDLFPYT